MNETRHGIMQGRGVAFLEGVALGMAVMYLADPDHGSRRRALVRDKAARVLHDSQNFMGKAGRDLRNRARGGWAAASHRLLHRDGGVVLTERVRSKMGRYVSHPHAIEVTEEDGCITLRGPILASEVQDLVDAVSHVRGVRDVNNQLDPHEQADVSALQGGAPPPGEPAEWQQRNWTPGLQLLTGFVVAAGLSTMALRRRRSGAAAGMGRI